MSLADFLVQIVNALSQASMLFLLSSGLALIFGIMRVVNFAHGSLYMLGAYVGSTTAMVTGSFWLALLVAPVVVAIVGLLFERVALSRLYNRVQADDAYLLLTFGLAMALSEVVRLVWGTTPQNMTPPHFLNGIGYVMGTPLPHYRVFLIAAGAVTALLIWGLLSRTRLGLFIRATSQNPEMIQALGTNVTRIRVVVFCLGCGLAALGGIIAVPLLTASLGMGNLVLVDAFIIVIIGGMGSFFGSLVGSLIIGFVEIFGVYYIPDFAIIFIYLIMIGVLTVRPGGFFGKEF